MLKDLLQALGLLMGILKSSHTPDKKRQKVAKRLLRIYLGIDNVVERGEVIIALLESSDAVDPEHVIEILLAQQRAMFNIFEELHNEDVAGLLRLHLPHFKKYYLFATPKMSRIAFYLSQLVEVADSYQESIELKRKLDEFEPRWWEMSEKDQDMARKELKQLQDRFAENSVIKSLKSDTPENQIRLSVKENEGYDSYDSEYIRLMTLDDLKEWSKRTGGRYAGYENRELTVSIHTAPGHISEARASLQGIAEQGAQLRSFLIEKFDFEDILQ